MKLVTAVINPYKLEEVREALNELGCTGMTVTEVSGFGRQRGHREIYRGAEYSTEYVPKVKVEVALAESRLEDCIDAICKAARSEKIGDGKIFVTDLSNVIRIRTGETGEEAV